MIYYLQSGLKGPIKIGYSENPPKRKSHLQTGNPERLRLIFSTAGNKYFEKKIHERFDHLRIRRDGEWFRPAADLLEFMDKMQRIIANSSIYTMDYR